MLSTNNASRRFLLLLCLFYLTSCSSFKDTPLSFWMGFHKDEHRTILLCNHSQRSLCAANIREAISNSYELILLDTIHPGEAIFWDPFPSTPYQTIESYFRYAIKHSEVPDYIELILVDCDQYSSIAYPSVQSVYEDPSIYAIYHLTLLDLETNQYSVIVE